MFYPERRPPAPASSPPRRTVRLVPVTLRSTIRQKPAEGAKDRDGLATQELEATAGTYDDALEQLRARVPDGWQMLGISRR